MYMFYERDIGPTSLYQAKLKNIALSALAERCMFFLGAGASAGPKPSLPTASELSAEMAKQCKLDTCFLSAGTSGELKPSLPTPNELSAEMAKQCRLEWYDYIPLSTIAFYFESYFTREVLNDFLKQQIGNDAIP